MLMRVDAVPERRGKGTAAVFPHAGQKNSKDLVGTLVQRLCLPCRTLPKKGREMERCRGVATPTQQKARRGWTSPAVLLDTTRYKGGRAVYPGPGPVRSYSRAGTLEQQQFSTTAANAI